MVAGHRVRRGVGLACLVGVVLLGAACTPQDGSVSSPATLSGSPHPSARPSAQPTAHPSGTPRPTAHPSPPAGTGTALAALRHLPVKGRAPKTGYARLQFGPAWADTDHNGCDTRNDILRRDLHAIVLKPGTQGCVVLTGILRDPYGGSVISFQRGVQTSQLVQIDHVVALSDAWQTGAQQLSAATRLLFANDPLELLAVSGSLNEQKEDGDAATWLPPDRSYWPAYVARQIAVKTKYHLWVTAAEAAAMTRVLLRAPSTPLPGGP
ncbi:MAG TPA: HNH endonuclease family protein [Candidatus Nanopelagicales bacterium]